MIGVKKKKKYINLEFAVPGSQPTLTMQWNLLLPPPPSPGYIQPLGIYSKMNPSSSGPWLPNVCSLSLPFLSTTDESLNVSHLSHEPHLPFHVFHVSSYCLGSVSSLKILDPTVSLSSSLDV